MNPLPCLTALRRRCLPIGLALALLWPVAGAGKLIYVAPTGNDTVNTGNITSPYATIMRAQTAAVANDTVYLRGGNYTLTNAQITSADSSYNYVNSLTTKGVTYINYPGETPVFDFSNVKPVNLRMCAFRLNGSNITLQGFEIIGVQVTIATNHTQSECIRIDSGSNCVLRYLKMHDGMGIGVYIINNSANNLIENCDAYNNAGLDSGSIGNIDGFGCHVKKGNTGNTFRYDRSWSNSDDGYDTINCYEQVVFDHCWSYNNGFQGGDGNGFKSGGWASSAQNTIANPLPNHIVRYCISAGNKSHGYYANHQPGQSATWTYDTAYHNGTNFDTLERDPPDYSNTTAQTVDIAGVAEVMHYNLNYAVSGTGIGDYAETGNIVTNNSWTLNVTVNAADFVSTNMTELTRPRQADGSLPILSFMHLVTGSDCAGLGAFESAPLGVAAAASTSNVTISWGSILGAMGYTVSRSTTSGGNYTALTGNLSNTTTAFSDTTATNGTKYYYVVTATNGEDTSANSVEVNATPLAAPTGVTATPGNGNVSLSWGTVTGAANYTVQRSTTSGSGYVTVATNVSATTYKDTTTANNTTYYYRVIAANGSGSSGGSTQASATPEPPAPATPTGVAATAGNGNVSLSWTAASGATSYVVSRTTTTGVGYTVQAAGLGTPSYFDTAVTNGTTYYYVVAASNSGGMSGTSAEVSATPAETFSQWAASAFPGETDPAIIGPAATPAGDGISNLLKSFYGLDPATNAGAAPVSSGKDNTGNMVFNFRIAKNLTGVTYQIQESTDLIHWTPTGVQGTVVSDQGTYYQMQAVVPLGANTNLYLRVVVSM
jgi:fibronectin type 3 domain-containing protein